MFLELHANICFGFSIPVAACLRYLPAEPYSVYLDCHVDIGNPVTWEFARELLARGLLGRAGAGDVHVRPGTGKHAGGVIVVLRGARHAAVLRAPASGVRAFLAVTELLVPFGMEELYLDWTAVLGWLTGEGPSGPRP